MAKQLEVKREAHKTRRDQVTEAADQLKEALPQSLQRSMQLSREKGALLIEELGFTLPKRAFQDAIALRYNMQPKQSPSTCGCGSIEHALSCPKGSDITR